MVLAELIEFHAEATKRGILNTVKECSVLLNSLPSLPSDFHVNFHEPPRYSFVRALWQLGDYNEIINLCEKNFEKDHIILYFYIQSLLKLRAKTFTKISSLLETLETDSNDVFIQFCFAQFNYLRNEYDLAFSESIKILRSCPYFWDTWLLLISSVRNINQVNTVFELIQKKNSLMSLQAALLLHIRVRSSATRQFFALAIKNIYQEDSTKNLYLESIIFKYHLIESDIQKLNITQHHSWSLQMADIYSDYLYVTSKKDELANFAKDIANSKGWTKETCYVIGNFYSCLNQHEKALVWLRRALVIDPNYEAALIVSGNEYIELKSPNDAISMFLTASKLNPLNYRIFFSLGSVFYLLDDLDQSIYYLKIAVGLENDDYRSYELLAECYQNIGFPEHAVGYLISALKCNRCPFILSKKLALLYHLIGNSRGYIESYARYFEECTTFERKDNMLISDDSDFDAASRICLDNNFTTETTVKERLSRALLSYNKTRENIVFDYSELQMLLKSVTNSDDSSLHSSKVDKIINSTYENSRNCVEIFEIIKERLNSNRSTTNNLIKTLELLEILLVRGSEKFISIATNDKKMLKRLTIHENIKVKQKAEAVLQLETDRNSLFSRRDKKNSDFPRDEQGIFKDLSSENLNI